MITSVQTVDAAELLMAGLCHAACLLGRERGPCECRCGGRYHGDLRNAQVHLPVGEWWTVANWSLSGEAGQASFLYGLWGSAYATVRTVRNSWSAFITCDPYKWDERGALLVNRFTDGLRTHGRIAAANRAPAALLGFARFRNEDEAHVVPCLVLDAYKGSIFEVVLAIEVLEGRPFPASSPKFNPDRLADMLAAGYVSAS